MLRPARWASTGCSAARLSTARSATGGASWTPPRLTPLVVAICLPLREPLWRAVRRWVLGEREEPYRVVSGLAERLERTDGAEEELLAVAAAVAEAFRSPHVGVEVEQVGGGRRIAEH